MKSLAACHETPAPIGYLVPEFPGQSHAFFWREIRELERIGIQPRIVSTRRPAQAVVSHRWSGEAIARTTYLFPFGPRAMASSLWEILRAGPAGWWRCLCVIAAAGSIRRGGRLLGLLLVGGQVAALARRQAWRHLHVHSCADSANIALFAHLLAGLPYSLTLHGDLCSYGANQERKWRAASFAIVISQTLKRQVREAIGDDLETRVEIAPMGVDLNLFTRATGYEPFRRPGRLRVFSCSRLHPGKGHDDLIRAVKLLRDRGIDAHLAIAGEDSGDGACRAGLTRLIQDLSLGDAVRLLGAIDEAEVKAQLEGAHVFALATHHEGLGVAIMEAMAMHLPVVATRTGGVPELVADGVDGLLVEPRNIEQLADAIERCARAPELCLSLGDAARRKVEQSFHSGRSAQVLAACLKIEAPVQAPDALPMEAVRT